jgi:hypothetical protein
MVIPNAKVQIQINTAGNCGIAKAGETSTEVILS